LDGDERMKKIILLIISITFTFLLITVLLGFNTLSMSSVQDYKNIKINDIKDCLFVKSLNPYTYTIKLSKDEVSRITELICSSGEIGVLTAGMPSSYYWININLKSGKTLKLLFIKGGIGFNDNGMNYKMQLPNADKFLSELRIKYIDIPPDKCDLVYIYNLFSDYGMNLASTKGYHLGLNWVYGNYCNCNNDTSFKIAIYTYDSEQKMLKGLSEYRYKYILLSTPYQKIYYAKNIIIILLGKNANNIYESRITAMVDHLKGDPDNLFPIESYKVLSSIENSNSKEFGSVLLTTFESNKIVSKEYEIKENDSADLIVPNNEEFILSFYFNYSNAYKWNLKNKTDNSLLRLDKRNLIGMQNFYFKALKEGCQKAVFRYESTYNSNSNDFVEVTLNIIVK
jgi:hypothetical protein